MLTHCCLLCYLGWSSTASLPQGDRSQPVCRRTVWWRHHRRWYCLRWYARYLSMLGFVCWSPLYLTSLLPQLFHSFHKHCFIFCINLLTPCASFGILLRRMTKGYIENFLRLLLDFFQWSSISSVLSVYNIYLVKNMVSMCKQKYAYFINCRAK